MLVVGGTIPSDDIPELKELGVAEVFTPGAPVRGSSTTSRARSRARPPCRRPAGVDRRALELGDLHAPLSRKLRDQLRAELLGPLRLDLGEQPAPLQAAVQPRAR